MKSCDPKRRLLLPVIASKSRNACFVNIAHSMEIKDQLIAQEVDGRIAHSWECPFDIQSFDFLHKYLQPTTDELIVTKTRKIHITCFDVNQNYFVFGTSCGRIYVFKRHVFNSQQTFKYRLISSQINLIKLITDELLAFVTESSVYIWNRLNHKFLYGWKCPTKSGITCLQTFLSVSDQKLLIISGDSNGCVRYHDLLEGNQNVIFTDAGFQIIQLEFIDRQTILVSTSFRTVIVENAFSQSGKQSVVKIGKNERKTCGKFGAIYSQNSSLIYGSRPSLHLIKAELNGEVIETIRVNNVEESEGFQQLAEVMPKPITGKVHYKLGVLRLFCNDQYIISHNESSLVIVRTDGQFCVKEKIDKLIDIKISAANSNEAFLLLESKQLIRIQNKEFSDCSQFDISSDYEKSWNSGEKSSDSKSSTESLLSLIKGPVIANPISFIDEELKKVFDFNKLQSKFAEKYNRFSSSIISKFDPQILPNSDKNVFISPEYENTINEDIEDNSGVNREESEIFSPLVVSRRGKRKNRVVNGSVELNGSDVIVSANDITHTNGVEKLKDNCDDISEEKSNESKILEMKTEYNETTDDNRLEMILSVYREANNLNETDEVNNFETDSDDTNADQILSEYNGQELESATANETQPKPDEQSKEDKPDLCSVDVDKSNDNLVLSWNQLKRDKSDSELEFHSFCANGFNATTEVGLIWFLSKDKNHLIYYPSFESLKLGKGRITGLTCATYDLFVLTETGLIFRREGMDATKPLGTKWTQVKSNRSKFQITCISFNWKNAILWCCDSNGETWTHDTRHHKWSLIKDFSSHSIVMRKVSVSPINSRIIWGIDNNGKVFVRSFGANDGQNRLCGQQWDLVDGLLLASDIAVACDNTVLIVVPNEGIFRRKAIITAVDKINEWRSMKGPDLPPDDYVVKLSVTENSDIMAMTAEGSVWHTFGPLNRQSTREDSDWLLI